MLNNPFSSCPGETIIRSETPKPGGMNFGHMRVAGHGDIRHVEPAPQPGNGTSHGVLYPETVAGAPCCIGQSDAPVVELRKQSANRFLQQPIISAEFGIQQVRRPGGQHRPGGVLVVYSHRAVKTGQVLVDGLEKQFQSPVAEATDQAVTLGINRRSPAPGRDQSAGRPPVGVGC